LLVHSKAYFDRIGEQGQEDINVTVNGEKIDEKEQS